MITECAQCVMLRDLLTRLAKARAVEKSGYETSAVQELWREVSVVLEAKEGAK